MEELWPLNHNAQINTRRDLVEPEMLNVLNAYRVLDQISVVLFCALKGIRDVRQREQVKMAKREILRMSFIGGSKRDAKNAPPPGVKILSFSCSFRHKFKK